MTRLTGSTRSPSRASGASGEAQAPPHDEAGSSKRPRLTREGDLSSRAAPEGSTAYSPGQRMRSRVPIASRAGMEVKLLQGYHLRLLKDYESAAAPRSVYDPPHLRGLVEMENARDASLQLNVCSVGSDPRSEGSVACLMTRALGTPGRAHTAVLTDDRTHAVGLSVRAFGEPDPAVLSLVVLESIQPRHADLAPDERLARQGQLLDAWLRQQPRGQALPSAEAKLAKQDALLEQWLAQQPRPQTKLQARLMEVLADLHAQAPLRHLNIQVTTLDLGVQVSEEGCNIFALVAAKKAARSDGVAQLHEWANDTVARAARPALTAHDVGLDPAFLLEPAFFKHAMKRATIDAVIDAQPDASEAPVNKKGDTLASRFEKYERDTSVHKRGGEVLHTRYSRSYEEKRLDKYAKLIDFKAQAGKADPDR